jgi:hypothetical protein
MTLSFIHSASDNERDSMIATKNGLILIFASMTIVLLLMQLWDAIGPSTCY